LANSNGLPAAAADAGPAEMRGADLRLYLNRLADVLDASSIRATLRLMLTEFAAAIRNQESLIALEQLDGRDTEASMVRLRELRDAQRELARAYARRADLAAASLPRTRLSWAILPEEEARWPHAASNSTRHRQGPARNLY